MSNGDALSLVCFSPAGVIAKPAAVRLAAKRLQGLGFAASMTMRPSPEPRSTRRSPALGWARYSMRSTTASGETTNGTEPSSQAQLCACTDRASAAHNVPIRFLSNEKIPQG